MLRFLPGVNGTQSRQVFRRTDLKIYKIVQIICKMFLSNKIAICIIDLIHCLIVSIYCCIILCPEETRRTQVWKVQKTLNKCWSLKKISCHLPLKAIKDQ